MQYYISEQHASLTVSTIQITNRSSLSTTNTAPPKTEGPGGLGRKAGPLGNVLQEYNPQGLHQAIRLPGQHHDRETGLYYNRHRYYDPVVGSYVNQDPTGWLGGTNHFNYHENPLNWTDPMGLRSIGPPAAGTYYPRGQIPRPILRSDLPRRAAYEAAANMTQTPNPGYPGDPLDLPCIEWDCSDKNSLTCKSGDLKKSTHFIPPANSTADPPQGCRCVYAGRDPAYQMPFDPKVDPFSNAYDVKDNWKRGSRIIRLGR
ncbi:RHS repeat-associated core domain-containing protein [Delftia sp. S67]|nr:RHS repeat-associated core domain-containing protein [Delftia sp. S65]MBK0116978.1 RHS repeat-associated core domain-containing protein [Delftia sp. S67]MBK0128427.1 RHS repeat-associated core domain-containing protein [Delftia sp. S66]